MLLLASFGAFDGLWKRIWNEPDPRLTVFVLLLWGAVHGVFGLTVLGRSSAHR